MDGQPAFGAVLNARVSAWNLGTHLFQETTLLYDIGDGLLSDTLCFLDIFEGVKFFGSLVFYHPDLSSTSICKYIT